MLMPRLLRPCGHYSDDSGSKPARSGSRIEAWTFPIAITGQIDFKIVVAFRVGMNRFQIAVGITMDGNINFCPKFTL